MSLPSRFEVKLTDPLPLHIRILDILMYPLMFALGGFKVGESVQRTHTWHNVKIDPESLNQYLAERVRGRDYSKVSKNEVIPGQFHMPLFGGWKEYVVLQLRDPGPVDQWFVGWVTLERGAELSRIPLHNREVKMLTGPKGTTTDFFAVDTQGNQKGLEVLDYGTHGDRKYGHLPLL